MHEILARVLTALITRRSVDREREGVKVEVQRFSPFAADPDACLTRWSGARFGFLTTNPRRDYRLCQTHARVLDSCELCQRDCQSATAYRSLNCRCERLRHPCGCALGRSHGPVGSVLGLRCWDGSSGHEIATIHSE